MFHSEKTVWNRHAHISEVLHIWRGCGSLLVFVSQAFVQPFLGMTTWLTKVSDFGDRLSPLALENEGLR